MKNEELKNVNPEGQETQGEAGEETKLPKRKQSVKEVGRKIVRRVGKEVMYICIGGVIAAVAVVGVFGARKHSESEGENPETEEPEETGETVDDGDTESSSEVATEE